MIFLRLYFEFFKIGLFSVGGGLATLPFLYELSAKTGWFTVNDISNMIAVSESTPGPLGVNMATYVGYITSGIFGGAVATLGLITPAIAVIAIISHFLNKFKENKYVKFAMAGLRAASLALISVAGIAVMRVAFLNKTSWDLNGLFDNIGWKSIVLAAALFAVTKVWKKHSPIVLIVAAGLCGFLFKL